MNNEVLGNIEEYNNGGLFSSSTIPVDAATLFNLLSPPINSISFSKEKTIDLAAEQTITTALVHDDPADVEQYIRTRLAQQLAEKLIEEDLIQIQSCEDIETKNTTFRAKIKVVQEQ